MAAASPDKEVDGVSLRLVLAGLALLLVTLGLNLPNSLDELATGRFWYLPAEILLAAALVMLGGPRLHPHLARLLGGILALMILIRVVDRLAWLWFGRELVLATDLELVLPLLEVSTAGWRFVPLAAAIAALASMLLLLAWPLVHGLGAMSRLPRTAALAPMFLAGLWLVGGPVSGFGLAQAAKQIGHFADARAAQARFEHARALDPWRQVPAERLFTALRGVDVLVVFVESYGRSSFEQMEIAPVVAPSLDRLEEATRRAGKTLVSGLVRSPTVGGQSWLAHATLASGLRTTGQGGWRVYLREADADLAHLFRLAGHPTFMMQPAIVRAFPEAARLGFDRRYFAEELDYQGPRPGYVTMPDQFTLARVEEILATFAPGPAGRYGQIALIGSHAPFTPPVPPVQPWSEIGDGSLFAGKIQAGPSAAALWSDAAALRSAYAQQIAATLDVVAAWAALPAKRPRLVLILGDHEPAARVLGKDPGFDVPVHVLATSPDLAAPFAGAGFVPGARPDPSVAPPGMETLRQLLLEGFSTPADPQLARTSVGRPVP